MNEKNNYIDALEELMNSKDISEEEKINLNRIKNKKTNIMITGATGCGKSSTINALFNIVTATSLFSSK